MIACEYRDLITGAKRVIEGDYPAVYFGTLATQPNIRMDSEREINRRGVFRQIQHVAIRRKDVDSVLLNTARQMVFPWVAADFVMPLQNLSQPFYFLLIATRTVFVAVLVTPMGTDTEFSFF